jgi:uncharacterized protein (TIGR00369 family)
MSDAATPQASKNVCFVCGPDNPEGMQLKFSIGEEEAVVRGTFSLSERYQGSGLRAHGGIIASLVDDAMGKLNKVDGIVAPTAELTVEYLRPVPIAEEITVEARRSKQSGRNYFRECTIHDASGKLLVRGRGRFVKVADREAAR